MKLLITVMLLTIIASCASENLTPAQQSAKAAEARRNARSKN